MDIAREGVERIDRYIHADLVQIFCIVMVIHRLLLTRVGILYCGSSQAGQPSSVHGSLILKPDNWRALDSKHGLDHRGQYRLRIFQHIPVYLICGNV